MQGSLTGTHIPFVKTTHWTSALRLSSSTTTHYSLQLTDMKKKWCWSSSDTQHPNYVHTGRDVDQHRSKDTQAESISFFCPPDIHPFICTAIKPLFYTCDCNSKDTSKRMDSLSLCFCLLWRRKAVMSDLVDLMVWGEFCEQFLMCSQTQKERETRKVNKQREWELETVHHDTLPGMSYHSNDLSTHPCSPFPPSLLSTPPPPQITILLLSANHHPHPHHRHLPTSREKRLSCIQHRLSGRRKWIKERRRPIDSQCLRCQEPK